MQEEMSISRTDPKNDNTDFVCRRALKQKKNKNVETNVADQVGKCNQGYTIGPALDVRGKNKDGIPMIVVSI